MTMDRLIRDTIEDIQGVREPDPGPNATFLTRRCLSLRRKPLSEFTTEDLRIMLGQQVAVPILLPLAVTVLAADPFVQGDFYPGDLLQAVVRLPASAWHGATSLRDRLLEVLQATPLPDEGVDTDLRHAIAAFLNSSTIEDNSQ